MQGELLVAQADVQTRQMMMAQALQSMETALCGSWTGRSAICRCRSARSRRTSRSYPRAFENTLVTDC